MKSLKLKKIWSSNENEIRYTIFFSFLQYFSMNSLNFFIKFLHFLLYFLNLIAKKSIFEMQVVWLCSSFLFAKMCFNGKRLVLVPIFGPKIKFYVGFTKLLLIYCHAIFRRAVRKFVPKDDLVHTFSFQLYRKAPKATLAPPIQYENQYVHCHVCPWILWSRTPGKGLQRGRKQL